MNYEASQRELNEAARRAQAAQYATPSHVFQQRREVADTRKATEATSTLLSQLVQHSVEADQRERKMLRWTVAGVILAGIAAVASVVSIVIAL